MVELSHAPEMIKHFALINAHFHHVDHLPDMAVGSLQLVYHPPLLKGLSSLIATAQMDLVEVFISLQVLDFPYSMIHHLSLATQGTFTLLLIITMMVEVYA